MEKNRTFEDFYQELLLDDNQLFEEKVSTEDKYQFSIEEELVEKYTSSNELEEIPTEKPKPLIEKNGQVKWPRSSKVAADSLKKADFLCEIDTNHKSFISNVTGKNYMEAHHLIPISKQDDFEYSLDKVANVKCICPNCHRLIHHGTSSDKKIAIEKLYNKSKVNLEKIGLSIDLETLLRLYN